MSLWEFPHLGSVGDKETLFFEVKKVSIEVRMKQNVVRKAPWEF